MKTRLKIVELCWAEYSLCARLHLLDDYLPKGLYCSQTTYPKEPSFVFHLYILMGVESVALGALSALIPLTVPLNVAPMVPILYSAFLPEELLPTTFVK